jgi:hypothetical protein
MFREGRFKAKGARGAKGAKRIGQFELRNYRSLPACLFLRALREGSFACIADRDDRGGSRIVCATGKSAHSPARFAVASSSGLNA